MSDTLIISLAAAAIAALVVFLFDRARNASTNAETAKKLLAQDLNITRLESELRAVQAKADAELSAALAKAESDYHALEAKSKAELDAATTKARTDLEAANAKAKAELDAEKAKAKAEIDAANVQIETLRENAKKLDEAHKQTLEAVKSEMSVQTEKILKQREEELSKKAEETFKTISGNIGKDLKDMKEAFDGNKKAQTETTVSLKTQLDEAVKHLRDQAGTIGAKADHLADALRGQKKMQGCWGETILENIFQQEGLVEGRDYDKEETLRDEMGIVIVNAETGKRMRPDFVLHYPDNTDIIVDSKVSLNALADWFEASTPEAKDEAAKKNLDAIKSHIKELTDKRYADNIAEGKKSLGYVVMFVPNYGALQLAKQLEPNIVNEAFRQNVLLTTEETIMPFLRMIRTAWINVDQIRNQEKIVKAAQMMVERVADLCRAHRILGKKLHEAVGAYNDGSKKLAEGGQSIITAAHNVIKLGVPINSKKAEFLPKEDAILPFGEMDQDEVNIEEQDEDILL